MDEQNRATRLGTHPLKQIKTLLLCSPSGDCSSSGFLILGIVPNTASIATEISTKDDTKIGPSPTARDAVPSVIRTISFLS